MTTIKLTFVNCIDTLINYIKCFANKKKIIVKRIGGGKNIYLGLLRLKTKP